MAHCEENLQEIYQGLLRYRAEHGGAMPASLEELAQQKYVTLWALVCPANHYPIGESSYVFRGADWPGAGTGKLILVYDKNAVHRDRRNILFGDGRMDRIPERLIDKAIRNDNEERERLGWPAKERERGRCLPPPRRDEGGGD